MGLFKTIKLEIAGCLHLDTDRLVEIHRQWHSGKESACPCRGHRDVGSNPGSGRYPGGGHGYPLQCSCLENSMDRGAWWAAIHGIPKSQTQLSD